MKVLYQGIFFDVREQSKLFDKSSVLLPVLTVHPHVTFAFKPNNVFPAALLGREVQIQVIGEGFDAENHGFQVVIPEELRHIYQGAAVPHITVSTTPAAKNRNTAFLSFKPIDPFTISGRFGLFVPDRPVYSLAS